MIAPRPWLAPAGALFGGAAALRAALYRHRLLPRARLGGPVVSVGNLSVGGSGKTPVVAWVAATLRDAGLPVAVLSRGYRGAFRGEALVVSDGTAVLARAAEAGDEPVMLARDVPGVVVAVGPRRDVVGRAVEARFGRRVHVLDDGFQHLRLHRDLDLLCLDAADLDDRPLPAGRLREFPSAAARADVVLLAAPDGADPARLADAEARLGRERTVRVRRGAEGFFGPDGAHRAAPSRPFLLSGIARPERFAADVAAASGGVVGHRTFPDHYAFSPAEVASVADDARRAGADAIVTTAKDVVRMAAPPSSPPLLVFRVAVQIEQEARLRQRLMAVAGRAE
ncbi:MAG: tetraacyldisaccharide 4'-kinase [Acidobacteria bacterium]|nr:tetraacyldisaccharide 4'-kinase [Acidobacteriota bacterium]